VGSERPNISVVSVVDHRSLFEGPVRREMWHQKCFFHKTQRCPESSVKLHVTVYKGPNTTTDMLYFIVKVIFM
jgi:hypothetical protein